MDECLFVLEMKSILQEIMEVDSGKSDLINKFQEKVWNYDGAENDAKIEVLVELAYDLDYYQPNSEIRKEDNLLYGEERMIQEVKTALSKLC